MAYLQRPCGATTGRWITDEFTVDGVAVTIVRQDHSLQPDLPTWMVFIGTIGTRELLASGRILPSGDQETAGAVVRAYFDGIAEGRAAGMMETAKKLRDAFNVIRQVAGETP